MRRADPTDPGSASWRACGATGTLARVVLLLGALLPASGCTLGPDYVTPEAPVADAWLEQGDERLSGAPADHAAWWKVFKDPVLDHLIETAYAQNLSLQEAGLRVLEFRARLGIAVGNQYPQMQQAQGGYARTQESQNVADPVPTRAFDEYAAGFDAEWEIDFWGRFRRGIESADASLLASVADYDSVLVALLAEVAATYVQVRAFEERLVLVRGNIADQEEGLRLTELQFSNGTVTELDVQQATSLLNQTRSLVPTLEIGLRQSKNLLAVLLGRPPGDIDSLLTPGPGIPIPPATVAVGIPADLVRRRPDVRAAERRAAARSAQIGIAETDLYPTFTITGSLGWQSDSSGNLFQRDSLAGSVGPGFSWNLFNYGRLENRVREADAAYQEAVVSYQNQVLEAAAEVENGIVGYLKSQEQAAFLGVSVAASQRSVDLSMLQYKEGIADYTRVLDSQESLLQLEEDQTVSRADVVLNLIAVYKALGGGWQISLGRDLIPAPMREEMAERTDWDDMLGPTSTEDEDLFRPQPEREP